MQKLGIIGCGITGAVAAMLLKQKIPTLSVVVLEKSRGIGGRMCTSRSSFGSCVDLGAQFITRTNNLSIIQEKCYSELIDAGLLCLVSKNIEGLKTKNSEVTNYTFPNGSGSMVKFFLNQSNCQILFGHKVIKLSISQGKFVAACDNGSDHEFDALVLTIPVPQLLQLQGFPSIAEEHHCKSLSEVQYCSRFAVGYYYEEESEFFKNNSWDAKFLTDDIIKYCSFSANKQNNGRSLPSILFHTSKEFGRQYIDENVSVVQDMVCSRIKKLFPDMPTPTEVKFHKWRYSQVEMPYKGESGCLVVSKSPLLICGGDGFTHSNFENCILSAEKIMQEIL